ncbi:MAG: S41 family peptidase [Burkholderiaceae bacterium]
MPALFSAVVRPSRCRARHAGLTAAFTALLLIAGCGGGGGGGTDTAPATDKISYLIETMKSWYLWRDRLPVQIEPTSFADVGQALEALRVSEDRYSNVVDAQSQERFYADGQTIAFGILYRIRAADLLLLMVSPNSPAYAAGMRRGQRILAIDGESIASLQAEGRLDAAFGPVETGIVRRFTLDDHGTQREPTVTKGLFDITYVLADAVFERAGRRIGYLAFHAFAEPGVAPWQDALDRLLAAGAQDLIVDLRTNGGGLIATAATVGSAIAEMAGRTMTQLRFNDAHDSSNRAYLFREDPRAGRFDRLVWLTDGNTCSASEAMILGISAWHPGARIGSTTCGKPVGFTPTTFEDLVFNIVTFSLESPLGVRDYYDGLIPDCPVVDDGAGQLGEANETLTAAALDWLETGMCPAAAGPTTKTGTASATRSAWPDPVRALQ